MKEFGIAGISFLAIVTGVLAQVPVVPTLMPQSRSVNSRYVCYNSPVQFFEDWRNPGLVEGVKSLQPGILRFPGGTISNYWDWQTGTIVDDSLAEDLPQQVPTLYRQIRGQTQGTLADVHLLQTEVGNEVLFTLNLITSSLDREIETLRQAQKQGIPIRYIQLGNELYFSEPNYLQRFPSVIDYAQTVKQWIPALRSEFPEAKIAIIGIVLTPEQMSRSEERLLTWNQNLITSGALEQADGITLHRYQVLSVRPVPGEPFQLSELPTILNSARYYMDAFLVSPQTIIIPPQKSIWITEHNINEGASPSRRVRVLGTWANGLYAVLSSLYQLEDQRIELSCLHELMGNPMWQAMIGFKREIMNPDLGARESQPVVSNGEAFSASGSGMGLTLLAKALREAESATQLQFIQKSSLYGWKFSSNRQDVVVIINQSDISEVTDLSKIFPVNQPLRVEQRYGDPRTTITKNSDINSEIFITNKSVVLPGYSISLVGTKSKISN